MKKLRVILIIFIFGLLVFYNCTVFKIKDETRVPTDENQLIKVTENYEWLSKHIPDATFAFPCREKELKILVIVDSSKNELANVIETSINQLSSDGFGGDIDLAIVYDKNYHIIGVEVLGHSETKSYIDKVITSGYLEKFKGLSLTEDLITIDAVSGATYTSQGILSGVQNVQKRIKNIAIIHKKSDSKKK